MFGTEYAALPCPQKGRTEMKAFIFDLDGTLLDSMHVWLDVDIQFLRRHGYTPPPTLQSEIAVMTFDECATYFRERFRLPMTNAQIIAEWKDMVRHAYRETIEAKPGAAAFVHRCAADGMKICAATGSQRENAEAVLARIGIAALFDFIVTSDEVGKGKNFPDIYERCAARFGLPPAECVVVEDVLSAAQTARRAGFEVWGIYDPASGSDWDAMQQVCTRTFRSFEEL